MIKLLYTADNHVGCRQYGMKDREEDFYLAIRRVSEFAIKNQVNVVVVSGDLFDSAKPPARAVLEVKNCVDRLRTDGIEVLGIEGNHDLTGDNYWLRVCGITPLNEGYENSILGLRAIGVNYSNPDTLLSRLEEIATSCEAEKTSYPVVALHCGVAEMKCPFNQDVSEAQLVPLLKRIGCTFCALGHIHIPVEHVVDGIVLAQPGSTEAKSLDEPKEKSVGLVTMEENTGKVLGIGKARIPSRPITLYNVKDDVGIDGLRKADPNSLSVAYVDKSVPDGVARATAALSSAGCLFRIIPAGEAAERKECDRGKSMDLLKDAVLEFFDEGSEQYRMVMEIIDTGNPRMVAETYLAGEPEKPKEA